MEAGSFISKEESKLLQGAAVCLMVFHHLFAFPERIHVPYLMVLNFDFLNIETLVAYFGRICVAIFAFNSGYGMRKSSGDLNRYRILLGYKSMAVRLWAFAKRFWMVFLFFVGTGLVLRIYTFQPVSIIKGLLGYSYSYNGEWWYIGEYVRFLILFPILMQGLKLLKKHRHGNWIHGMILVMMIIVTSICPEAYRKPYIICFLCGMFFADVPIYEWLHEKLSVHSILYSLLSLGILGAVFIFRTSILDGHYDFIHVSFWVFGFVGLLKCNHVRSVLQFVLRLPGKYSTYIWLTHTFFGYYLFQKLTFMPVYSPLIFVWCLMLTILTGWGVENILKRGQPKGCMAKGV